MTVKSLKLGGRDYVIIPKKDFQYLQERAKRTARPARRSRRLTEQERGDVAEAERRLGDSGDRAVPYEEARRRLGLA